MRALSRLCRARSGRRGGPQIASLPRPRKTRAARRPALFPCVGHPLVPLPPRNIRPADPQPPTEGGAAPTASPRRQPPCTARAQAIGRVPGRPPDPGRRGPAHRRRRPGRRRRRGARVRARAPLAVAACRRAGAAELRARRAAGPPARCTPATRARRPPPQAGAAVAPSPPPPAAAHCQQQPPRQQPPPSPRWPQQQRAAGGQGPPPPQLLDDKFRTAKFVFAGGERGVCDERLREAARPAAQRSRERVVPALAARRPTPSPAPPRPPPNARTPLARPSPPGLAGAVSRTATAPIDRLKMLLQVQESQHLTLRQGLKIMASEGECSGWGKGELWARSRWRGGRAARAAAAE
jgi:hypothetical protein